MRLVLTVVALLGGFILVAMLVAPHQAEMRAWYLDNACSHLDKLSTDICAAIRRESGVGRGA